MKIVIIEDEQITANDLASTIQRVEPQAQIVAILKSVEESIAFFKENRQPLDLIFSDIQLGDGLSFEIFRSHTVDTPIIFCTAFDEYALNAFEVNGIHYMLKPFSSQTVSEAIDKFKLLKNNLTQGAPQYDAILKILNNRKSQKSILVHQRDMIMPIRIDNIALYYIENEITYLITFDKKRYSISKTLDELENISGNDFYRANRQFLVNRRAVKHTSQYFARKLAVTLNIPFDGKITISKTKVTEFLDWLSSG